MKYLLFAFIIFNLLSCCKNDKECAKGEIKSPFSGNCTESEGRTYYLGKTSFYCLSDSLAVGINIENKTVNITYKDEFERTGGIGNFNYMERDNFHLQCETEAFGESNTTVYFDDISILENLPATIKINLYQNDWNIPYTKYDSTSIILYKK